MQHIQHAVHVPHLLLYNVTVMLIIVNRIANHIIDYNDDDVLHRYSA